MWVIGREHAEAAESFKELLCRSFTAEIPLSGNLRHSNSLNDSAASACSRPITHITLVGSAVIEQKRASHWRQPVRRSLTTGRHPVRKLIDDHTTGPHGGKYRHTILHHKPITTAASVDGTRWHPHHLGTSGPIQHPTRRSAGLQRVDGCSSSSVIRSPWSRSVSRQRGPGLFQSLAQRSHHRGKHPTLLHRRQPSAHPVPIRSHDAPATLGSAHYRYR